MNLMRLVMRNTWIKCLLFLCTLCTIYFTQSPSVTSFHSVEYYTPYIDQNVSHARAVTSVLPLHEQINRLFGSINDANVTFIERATFVRSLAVTSASSFSLPKMYNIGVHNNSVWSCLTNVISYLQFYNIKAIVTDESLLMLLLTNVKTSTIDSSADYFKNKHNNVINLAIVIDDQAQSQDISNDLLQLCYSTSTNRVNNRNTTSSDNSSDINIICDAVRDENTPYQSNHIYIQGICANFSIQLTTFHVSQGDKWYTIEQVNQSSKPDWITEESSNYGTLDTRQLVTSFKLQDIDINIPVMQDTSHDNRVIEIITAKISVPSDPVNYLLDLYSSKWITCNNGTENLFTDSLQYPRNKTTDEVTKLSIVYLTKLLRPLHIPFWLMSGTLLGWYRECRAIPFTTDADFAAFSTTLSSPAVDKIFALTRRGKYNNLKLFYRFGKIEKGFELSFKLPRIDWKIDLFFMYPTEDAHVISTVGHAAWKSEYYEYFYPSIDSLCSSILFDEKVNVPCNVLPLINTEYGADWYLPKQNYSYVDSPTNRGPVLKWSQRDDGKQVTVYG